MIFAALLIVLFVIAVASLAFGDDEPEARRRHPTAADRRVVDEIERNHP